jgi:hypothetical protein
MRKSQLQAIAEMYRQVGDLMLGGDGTPYPDSPSGIWVTARLRGRYAQNTGWNC